MLGKKDSGLIKFSHLVEMLRVRAQERPEFECFTFLEDGESQETRLSYLSLDKKSRTIGGQLQARGLSGERAVLLYPPGLDYVAGFFGCLYGGVTAVPAYPPDPNRLERTLPRLISIIKDSQAKVILTTETIRSMASFLCETSPELKKLEWVATDTLDENSADAWKEPKLSENSLAFLQYTSGSTGNPKGVMLSHGNLLHNVGLINQGFATKSQDVGVIWLPPYHDMGLIGGVLTPLFIHMQVVLLSPLHFLQKPLRWLEAISKYRGTKSGGPNFAYEMCIRKVTPEQLEQLDLSSWDLAFTGAEPVLPHTLDRFEKTFSSCGFKKQAFYPCYGLAEGTLIVTGGTKGEPVKNLKISKDEIKNHQIVLTGDEKKDFYHLVGCGHSFPDQNVAVVNPESFVLCAPEEVGEIWVQGPSVAQGYWQQEGLSRETFQATVQTNPDAGQFLRTGDLGFLSDGELFVTGRLKDLIIIRGNNHYPQDIELTVEKSHSALRPGCGAAFAWKEEGEERLILVQELDRKVLQSEKGINFSEVVSKIQEEVSRNHDLEVYGVVFLKPGTIPKTSSGKISRYSCRLAYQEGSLEVLHHWKKAVNASLKSESEEASPELPASSASSSEVKPLKELENWLVDRISQTLEVAAEEIDVCKPLFRFGLDSRAAVAISGELEEYLGRSLKPTLLWNYPTIEALAQYLNQEIKPSES